MNNKEKIKILLRTYRKVGLAMREICQDLEYNFFAEISGELGRINNKIYKKLEELEK